MTALEPRAFISFFISACRGCNAFSFENTILRADFVIHPPPKKYFQRLLTISVKSN